MPRYFHPENYVLSLKQRDALSHMWMWDDVLSHVLTEKLFQCVSVELIGCPELCVPSSVLVTVPQGKPHSRVLTVPAPSLCPLTLPSRAKVSRSYPGESWKSHGKMCKRTSISLEEICPYLNLRRVLFSHACHSMSTKKPHFLDL